ncbi:MAG: transposase [Oscillospiraceae bacterium]|nr:transposase [Oscillospiraceae bacterium]
MESELDETLGYEKSNHMSNDEEIAMSKNYRNRYSKKTVKTQLGEMEVKVPHDRNGEYRQCDHLISFANPLLISYIPV